MTLPTVESRIWAIDLVVFVLLTIYGCELHLVKGGELFSEGTGRSAYSSSVDRFGCNTGSIRNAFEDPVFLFVFSGIHNNERSPRTQNIGCDVFVTRK